MRQSNVQSSARLRGAASTTFLRFRALSVCIRLHISASMDGLFWTFPLPRHRLWAGFQGASRAQSSLPVAAIDLGNSDAQTLHNAQFTSNTAGKLSHPHPALRCCHIHVCIVHKQRLPSVSACVCCCEL